MGIALTTVHAPLNLLHTLIRWLQLAGLSVADSSRPTTHPNGIGANDGGVAAGADKPPQRPTGTPGQRPPRGNWPFTVSPQNHPPRRAAERLAANGADNQAFVSSPASARPHFCRTAMAGGNGGSAPKMVLHKAQGAGGTGRLVISGRMADVCAELDRMAASEAAAQAY